MELERLALGRKHGICIEPYGRKPTTSGQEEADLGLPNGDGQEARVDLVCGL